MPDVGVRMCPGFLTWGTGGESCSAGGRPEQLV